jgi:C_GCAxxG_C_C family probable redox protein
MKQGKSFQMEKAEKAARYFDEGFNCSQAVFTAIAEKSGIEKELALRIASGFGGGMARMQKTCGAVTGAVMAIGYLQGNVKPDAIEEREKVYELIHEFVNRFTQKHKTIECRELLGHSLKTQDDRAKAKELHLFETVCSKCVKDAVLLVEDITRPKL